METETLIQPKKISTKKEREITPAPKLKQQPISDKAGKKEAEKDLSKTYNEFKQFEGQQYSGMKVGRSHKWNYDKSEWREQR